jgi:hypothetical protein
MSIKRPEPVTIPDRFPITKLPPGKVRKAKKRRPKRAWTLRRDEAVARRAENNRYINTARRLAERDGSKYELQVIEHAGMWAVAKDGEIIKAGLTKAQARRFVDRSRRFVALGSERKDRM